LTNTVDPGLGAVSAAMLVAMAAMFVAALAVPDAFGAHGVLFGVALLIVTVMYGFQHVMTRTCWRRFCTSFRPPLWVLL
jgi:low temperature requirement protein LtrA